MPTQTRVAGVAFSTTTGGRIAVPPDGDVAVPGRIRQLPAGISFGPLAVRPGGDGPVGVDHLTFPSWDVDDVRPGVEGAAGLAGGGLAAAAVTSEQQDDGAAETVGDVDRRGFLAGTGLALCGAVLGAEALTADGTAPPHLELHLAENPDGVTLDLVEPVDRSPVFHEVRLDGSRIGELAADSTEGVHVPAGRTGRVTIHSTPGDAEN